jgi:hypothetical protein
MLTGATDDTDIHKQSIPVMSMCTRLLRLQGASGTFHSCSKRQKPADTCLQRHQQRHLAHLLNPCVRDKKLTVWRHEANSRDSAAPSHMHIKFPSTNQHRRSCDANDCNQSCMPRTNITFQLAAQISMCAPPCMVYRSTCLCGSVRFSFLGLLGVKFTVWKRPGLGTLARTA